MMRLLLLPETLAPRNAVTGIATFAVDTTNPVQVPLMPGEAFARLYGLTGREARVLLAFA